MSERIGRNIFSLSLSRITSGLLLFFVYAKLGTYLGPTGFGKFSLILALQTIFLLFVDLGISRFAVKKISEDRARTSIYYGNFLLAQLFLSLVLCVIFVSIPYALHYDVEVTKAMVIVGIGLFFTAMSIPSVTVIQAWQKIHIFALIIFVESLMKAVWFIYALLRHQDLEFIFAIYVLVGVFDLIIWLIVANRVAPPKFQFESRLVRTMVLFGIPFAMISGFEMLIAKIDTVIQKFFLPYLDVGLYSAAYRFLDFLTFIPAVVAISLFPFLSESPDLRRAEVQSVLDRYNRYMMVLAVPLGVGATLFADKIIFVLFGAAFRESVLPFQILIWSTVVTFLYAVPNVVMQVKQTRRAVLILALAALFNAVANIVLIPRYGILASAWLTVVTYLLVAVLYIFYSRRIAAYSFLPNLLWPFFSSVVMGAALWFTRSLNIFLITGAAFVIYFGVLWLGGFLNQDDWRFAKSIIGR